MNLQIEPGAEVWVLERDEDGTPYDIFRYMFLASAGESVIVSPYINGTEDLEDILAYREQETAEGFNTELAVFPVEDCFTTREAAFAARVEQKGGRQDEAGKTAQGNAQIS